MTLQLRWFSAHCRFLIRQDIAAAAYLTRVTYAGVHLLTMMLSKQFSCCCCCYCIRKRRRSHHRRAGNSLHLNSFHLIGTPGASTPVAAGCDELNLSKLNKFFSIGLRSEVRLLPGLTLWRCIVTVSLFVDISYCRPSLFPCRCARVPRTRSRTAHFVPCVLYYCVFFVVSFSFSLF